MQKLVRLFLLCLVMLAIPVQGIAAATMPYCDAEHHHSMTTHQIEQHDHSSDIDAGTLSDNCSSCAACCIGGCVIESSEFAILPPFSQEIHLCFSSPPNHIEDGPERPPRA